MKKWFYKGYVLKQNTKCFHYMICDKKTGRRLMHCQCNKRLNKQEAHEHIDFFIELRCGKVLKVMQG